MFIGLLMVSHENDVLAETLANNLQFCDTFYVLDGTVPNDESKAICEATGKMGGYLTDAELPRPPFSEKPVCGYRRAIHEAAVADHGPDHWFLILHGDEWWEFDPRPLTGLEADCFVFNLPFYFPREEWDYSRTSFEQLKWNFRPGYPEPRMFKGSASVHYDPTQAWNAAPAHGLTNVENRRESIRHYLFRSPDEQRARAKRHVETGFDPDNYRHITEQDKVYFDDQLIQHYQSQAYFEELRHDDL